MAIEFSRRCFAGLALATAAAACASRGAGAGDLVIHGGPIYTGIASGPIVEAVRIRDGRIAFAGSLQDARAGGVGARVIHLRGAAAYPGFADSHMHLLGVGLSALQLDLTGVASLAAMLERLRAYAAAHPTGPITGRGWIETHWPEHRFPTRADLDAVVANRPVMLGRADGHAVAVNSAALALAGITDATADPNGGRIERDASGVATGMLIDNAEALAAARFPTPSEAVKREALRLAAQLYASRGWTRLVDMGVDRADYSLWEHLVATDEFPLAADIYISGADADFVLERGPFQDATGRLRVGGVKLYMDGALGSRGAALLAPYSDAPGSGLLLTPLDEMRTIMARARARGVQIATHAIGDRGNRLALDLYQETFAADPAGLRAARWRIEHAQVISPQDLPRFGQMGVIASMQPSHAIGDLHFAPARLGPERLTGAYAWASLLNSGAVIAAGSDAPVEKGDPLIEFYAAAHRHDLTGFVGPDWRLQEAVSRAQALSMLTAGGAYATFQERERGTIEIGKRADISAFSVDLMQAPFAEIPSAQAVLTISDGRITHSAL